LIFSLPLPLHLPTYRPIDPFTDLPTHLHNRKLPDRPIGRPLSLSLNANTTSRTQQ
jgi:hypothetical protein